MLRLVVPRRVLLVLPIAAMLAACTSGTSGHGSTGPTTSIASSATTSTAASSSAASSTSPPTNWTATVNFAALPHADMGCARAGEGGKVDVVKVVVADVTGDGNPDAVVRLECAHAASEWPDTVDVYSDSTGTPTQIGALLTATGNAYAPTISTQGKTVTLGLLTWSSFAPGCCPDLHYLQTFTWNGSTFIAGARRNDVHPCGDTALVVSAPGGSNSGAGHSAVVLLFHNRLPQPCTVYGYPGVDALTASGGPLAHATRTLSGYAGGATSVATITVGADQSASATLEWDLFNTVTSGTCAQSASIAVTPANTTTTTTGLPVHVTVCGLQIHPTVAGTTGRS
jgi:hypothetical protein